MNNNFTVKILTFLLLSSILTALLGFMFGAFELPKADTEDSPVDTEIQYTTVIIDAGHGGEDGGAVSASGIVEKDVNLSIALILRDMLRCSGINVVMTREDDRLLYDRNIDYHGRKKKLDLAARLAIAESTPNAIFLSIHMNSFTDPAYSGLQVWYSPNNTVSYDIASSIQSGVREHIQPQNNRKIKMGTSSIFLLDQAHCPAVLVECGFLSNEKESALLADPDYLRSLALVIFTSLLEYVEA